MSRVSILLGGYIFLTILFGLYLANSVTPTFAQTGSVQNTTGGIPNTTGNVGNSTGNIGNTTGSVSNPGPGSGVVKLENPLGSENDTIAKFLLKIIDVLLVFAIPIIILFIMYAGFLFVTARGNPSQIETARNALLWSVVGGVIILAAKLIIELIQGTISAF